MVSSPEIYLLFQERFNFGIFPLTNQIDCYRLHRHFWFECKHYRLSFTTNDVSWNVIKVKLYSNLCFLNLSKVIHKNCWKIMCIYWVIRFIVIIVKIRVCFAAGRSSSCHLFWEVERHSIYPLLTREYSHLMFSPSGIINSTVETKPRYL